MKRFLSHFVVLLLLAHMLLGCCWHHAHACTPACESACANSCSHDHGNELLAEHDEHAGSSSPAHHPTDACAGERCSFVAPPKTASECPLLMTAAVLQGSLPDLQDPAQAASRDWHHAWPSPLLPQRLHLLNCVLLI